MTFSHHFRWIELISFNNCQVTLEAHKMLFSCTNNIIIIFVSSSHGNPLRFNENKNNYKTFHETIFSFPHFNLQFFFYIFDFELSFIIATARELLLSKQAFSLNYTKLLTPFAFNSNYYTILNGIENKKRKNYSKSHNHWQHQKRRIPV